MNIELPTMASLKDEARAALIAKGVTFPRKKHSHRCVRCGGAVYCYKADCTKPQRLDACQYCR
jgi:hypothetical protein